RGRDAFDASLSALAPGTGEHQQVDARAGDPVPGFAAGADPGFGLAGLRPVPGDRAVGAHRARAARRPDRRYELLPRHRHALPALRAPARAAGLTARSASGSRATDEFRRRQPSIRAERRRRYAVSTTPSRKMFVNLPVRDLKRAVDFFTRLGFTF